MLFNNLVFLADGTTDIGSTMTKAGLNTLMGISIVFLSLAFISFVIYLFGKICSGKKKKVNTEVIEAAITEPEPIEEEELSNDEELVAVISAAIYAFEAEQGDAVAADGLVVRSIRRVAGRR